MREEDTAGAAGLPEASGDNLCVSSKESGACAVFLAWGRRRVSRYGEE